MFIGDLILISPAIYVVAAAMVVLMLGVIAARRPDRGLDHWLPTQYLAPATMVPALMLAGWVVVQSLTQAESTRWVEIGAEVTRAPAVGLFVTSGGHAQLVVDPFAAVFSFVALAATLIVMLISIEHFGERQPHKAEYYALLMLSSGAAALAAAACDLIAIYLCIEFIGLVSYVLAAYAKTDRRSGEAGLKYFLYGAASSAVMLYGMSILFGVTGGSTSLSAIANGFTAYGAAGTGAGWVGIMFTLVGLGFKLALVPFHFWAPDVYEGAPTPITAFLSVVSKAAGLAVAVRFVTVVAIPAPAAGLSWYWTLVILSAASMFYGNLVAIVQRNIKRMLAYSSIAQVGYMMVGVLAAMHVFTRAQTPSGGLVRANVAGPGTGLAGSGWDLQGVIVYVVAYLLMNLGAFAVVITVGRHLGSDDIDRYAGLMKRSPLPAAALTVFLLSLAGIPPTAGFLGKFLVFGSAVRVGVAGHPELLALAALGVINSVVSVYYYLNVARLMFFAEPDGEQQVRGGFAATAVTAVTLALTIGVVLFARPVTQLAAAAVYAPPAATADTVNSR